MRLAGAVLQKDASEPMQTDKNETTPLDFRPQLPQCDPNSDKFDESFLVTTEDGSTICEDVADGIEGWFNKDAMAESAKFAQGSTMGKDSAASIQFLTEDLWAPPVLSFGNASPRPASIFRLELECTDDAILQDGMATTNRIFQNFKMQQLALASPGVSVQLDENLQGSATSGNWRTVDVKQSCLADVTTMAYTVTDRTDKVSNALNYEFKVTVVPPQIDLNGGLVNINLGCNPGTLDPFNPSSLLGDPPSESGGCLSESFNILIFEDSISTSLLSDKCSSIGISRTWSLGPPTQVAGTEMEDFGNADCAADLAALAEPVTQVISIDCDDEKEEPPKMIPEMCLASPLRFAGFDLLATGLARIDILADGLASLFRDEALFDESGMPVRVVFANTTEPTANDNTVDEPVSNIFVRKGTKPVVNSVIEPKLKGKNIVEGSFVTFDGNNYTALLEHTFYVDYKKNAIRHREIVPDILREYTDLCRESIIGFQVKVENPDYDKNGKKNGKDEEKYEYHYLCFEAVCGEKLASTVPARRRLDNHIEELADMKGRTKISSRPSREEIRAKLEHGPYKGSYELDNEKRLFNLRAASAARRA
jgi:hypothetical protein